MNPYNKYKILEKKYRPNKDYLVYYPEISGMEDSQEKEVNKKLQELSNVKYIPANAQLDYNYFGDFLVEFFKKNLLVLELNGYIYYFGAAHGIPTKVYPHIDLTSGRFYELEDLFKKDSDYVKVISDIINYQIEHDEQYSYVFPDAFKGIKKNQPFYVGKDALYIYFEPYEIAPYAAGFPTFKIPYKEIMSIIDTKGGFWKSFN
ncbi:RsiV family protein [Clostridium cochlearium]|uniref:RsiV family protein n=1 Tax=Clostridium cochlearium TaxID=1494 RepID=UPI0039C391E8